MVDVPHLHARNPEVIGRTAALLGFLREVVQSGTQRSRDTRSWGQLWLCDLPAAVTPPRGRMVDVPHLHARNPEVIGRTAALLAIPARSGAERTQRSRDTRSWGQLWLCDLPRR